MQQKPQQGNKISSKHVSSETYIKSYKFLIYDPIYKGMSDKAKNLYNFLREKVTLFERMQADYESGQGSRSFLDEEGNIFILADNTELEYILNCSEPTVIKIKKELAANGLLTETPVKDKANRLYVLQPVEISEKWAWIDEVNKMRAEKEAKNKAKHKAKTQQEKPYPKKQGTDEKTTETPAAPSNLKNLSHRNSNNLSHRNLKNLSKTITKSLKLKTNKHKLIININPNPNPIDYLSLKVPEQLKLNIKRLGEGLGDHQIYEIQSFYLNHAIIQKDCSREDVGFLNSDEFSDMVTDMLQEVPKPIRNMSGLLYSWALGRIQQKRNNFFAMITEINAAEEQPAASLVNSDLEELDGFYFKKRV